MSSSNNERSSNDSDSAIKVSNGRLIVINFETSNQDVVSYFSDLKPEQIQPMFETALKVGVLSLLSANLTTKIDYVQKEFNILNEKYSRKLDETVKGIDAQFKDVFGEEGRLSKVIADHFGENGKIVKAIFDPSVEGSPLCRLKTELRSDIQNLSTQFGISEAVATNQQKTTQKGFIFEDYVESIFSEIAKQNGDILERTTTVSGKVKGSKKGDFVFSLGGKSDRRIVFEAKDTATISAPDVQRTLDEAMRNREACYGVLVMKNVESLPQSIGWFNEYNGNQLACALTSQDYPDETIHGEMIQIAYRWAKAKVMLESAREAKVDTVKLQEKVESITSKLGALSGIRTQCTNVEKASSAIRTSVDTMEREIKGELNALLTIISCGQTQS